MTAKKKITKKSKKAKQSKVNGVTSGGVAFAGEFEAIPAITDDELESDATKMFVSQHYGKPEAEANGAEEVIRIPWAQIYVIGRTNMRASLPRTEKLAAALQRDGQHTPVLVSRGGPPEQPYVLRAGFRRHRAFELNGWEGREMLAVVRPQSDALSRIADNWSENMEREEVVAVDQAELMHQLASGTYTVVPGEGDAVPVPKAVICERFGITTNHLNSLLRVADRVDAEVRAESRRLEAPLRLLFAISRLTGETKDETRELQAAALASWQAKQEALEQAGRQRAVRGEGNGNGSSSANGEHKGFLKPTRKLSEYGTVADYMGALRERAANGNTKVDREHAKVAFDVLAFLSGERSTFPVLTKRELQAFSKSEASNDE